jgi:hypothetical protein
MIQTACLELVLQTPEEVLAWVASLSPADLAEVSPEWIARVRSTPVDQTEARQTGFCLAGSPSWQSFHLAR